MVVITNILHARKTTSTANQTRIYSTAVPTVPVTPDVPGIYTTTISTQDQTLTEIEKLDSKTHAIVWTYKTDTVVPGGLSTNKKGLLAVKGNSVYVMATGEGNTNSYIYSLDASNGKPLWRVELNWSKYTVPGATSTDQADTLGMVDSATVADGILYMLARSGRLVALDATNGHVLWVYNSGTQGVVKDNSEMTNGKGQVIVDGTIYECAQTIVSNGVLYGSCYDRAFAVDAKDGTQLWSNQIDQWQVFNSLQVVDGTVYLTSTEASHHSSNGAVNGTVYAYDKKSGAQLW